MPHPKVGYLMETILREVNRGRGPTVRELQERTGAKLSTVYDSTNRLRRLGLVRRFPGPQDGVRGQGKGTGRVPARVWPTKKGKAHG